jgi:hypothetical protein
MGVWVTSGSNPVPYCGTRAIVRHVGIRVSAAPGGGNSWVFDLLKNGAVTVYQLTISGAAVYAELSDCLLLEDGDTWEMRRTPGGAPTNVIDTDFTIVLDQQEAFESTYSQHAGTTLFIGVVRSSLFSGQRWGSFIGGVNGAINSVVATPGAVTKVRWKLTSAMIAGGTYTVVAIKNGVAQTGAGGSAGTVDTRFYITAGLDVGTWTGTFELSAGDQVYWQLSYSGPFYTGTGGGLCVRFVADTDGESQFGSAMQVNMPTAAGTTYTVLSPTVGAEGGHTWNASEATALLRNDSAFSFTLKHLWVRIGGLFGGVPLNALTMSLRLNSGTPAGAPTVACAAGSGGNQDLARSMTVTPTDTFDLRNVQTGTAGLATLSTFTSIMVATAELFGACYPDASSDPCDPSTPPSSDPSAGEGAECECCVSTQIHVLNLALLRCGVSKTIDTLDDETRERLTGDVFYEHERQATLRSFPWPFATKYAKATDENTGYMFPIYGDVSDPMNDDWIYGYTYPIDCLFARRLVTVGVGRKYHTDPPPMRIGRTYDLGSDPEDDTLLVFSNEVDAILEYTADVECALNFTDPLFIDAFAWRCAAAFAPSLSRIKDMDKVCWQRYLDALDMAAAVAAKEQQQEKEGGASWIDARA